jgi:hypothetical protein
MSKMNWNRLGFFILGTFLGGWVFGAIGRILSVGKVR